MDDKQRDKRLRKTYNLSLEEYNEILAQQGGGCGICGRLPGKRALHVDHDHKVARTKVSAFRRVDGKGWVAIAKVMCYNLKAEAKKKSEAVQDVRRRLLRLSVRAILCWRCNSALQKLSDDPKLFRSAAEYLEKYYNK